MSNTTRISHEVPDAIDASNGINFHSVLAIVPPDAGPFSVGQFNYELDTWRYQNGLMPVTATFKSKRVRLRLQIPHEDGAATVVSGIFGGGSGNSCLFQNGSEIDSGLAFGTMAEPNPIDAMFHALHQRLSVTLPEVTKAYGSFVGLGPVGPHYVAKAAASGTRRALFDWPAVAGSLLIPTVVAVFVETYNQMVDVARTWEATGRVPLGAPNAKPLFLTTPSITLPQTVAR